MGIGCHGAIRRPRCAGVAIKGIGSRATIRSRRAPDAERGHPIVERHLEQNEDTRRGQGVEIKPPDRTCRHDSPEEDAQIEPRRWCCEAAGCCGARQLQAVFEFHTRAIEQIRGGRR